MKTGQDDKEMQLFLEKIMAFSNKTGIAFITGNIYGGLAGFWDYGPVGVEIKNRIKDAWWTDFVRNRDDIVGYEGAIITHPKVWEASGHLTSFNDPLIFCQGKCKKKHRLDHLVEDQLNIHTENLGIDELSKIIKKKEVNCPECGGNLGEPVTFNLMFNTHVGPVQDSSSVAYLRPENAQLIFSGFKNVIDSTRVKMPFGIAHTGVVFRNEISPRNFLFRVREYELMEFEYFANPEKKNDCPDFDEIAEYEINILSQIEQDHNFEEDYRKISVGEAWEKRIFKNKWQAYWLAISVRWFVEALGIRAEKLRLRQHMETELSHYALDTWDLEYKYPFGWKELMGCANRTQFDLTQHQEFSKSKMQFIEQTEEGVIRYIPYVVAEPSVGLGRILLTVIAEGYTEEVVKGRKRIVLKIHPRVAPYDVSVFPLQKDEKIFGKAREIFENLRTDGFIAHYDDSGSIGKRYRRHDEIGTPFCVTIDYETLEDEQVTIRNRDTMEQVRIPINNLCEELRYQKRNYKTR
ncbi:MAG: glycine--tRNA ligase [Candidatus Heimdallarchaeota archaeon]|nr:MAG: glycine--tRNA ligase [Candidatus Heimdallarchaeota archaeon]